MSNHASRSKGMDWCDFPRCDCRGWCRYSDVARQLAELQQSREECTFPRCGCRQACSYMAYLYPAPMPRRAPPPTPRKRPSRPRGNKVVAPEVVAAVGTPCPYCGHAMALAGTPMRQPTRDHIDPIALGGPNTSPNIVIACFTCNNDKDNRTLVNWYFDLEEAGDRRAGHVALLLKARRPGAIENVNHGEPDEQYADQECG